MGENREKPPSEARLDFISERVERCEYWRRQLNAIYAIVMDLSLDLEEAEKEAREIMKKSGSLTLLKGLLLAPGLTLFHQLDMATQYFQIFIGTV
jgi:hypothetical protein